MPIVRYLLSLFLTLFFITGLFAQEKYYPPKTPWHLADIWWEAKSETKNFQTLSMDFEIIGKTSKDTLLFIAPIGLSKLNGISFYGGIQTKVGGWKTKQNKTVKTVGKGTIFSRWSKDENPIGLEYAKGNATTHFLSAGYEGNFVSVRNALNWEEGKYQYRIKKLETTQDKGEVFTWFGAYVYDYAMQQEHYIGALKFAGETFVYGKKHAAFVEVYGALNKSAIPQITVAFEVPKINGQKWNVTKAKVYYPSNKYKAKVIPRFAHAQVKENKVIMVSVPQGVNALVK